jgi:hypothetical protein
MSGYPDDACVDAVLAVMGKAFAHAAHVESRANYVFAVSIGLLSLVIPVRDAIDRAGDKLFGVPPASSYLFLGGLVLLALSLYLAVCTMAESIIELPAAGAFSHRSLLRGWDDVKGEFTRLDRQVVLLQAGEYACSLERMAAAKKSALHCSMLMLVACAGIWTSAYVCAATYMRDSDKVVIASILYGLCVGGGTRSSALLPKPWRPFIGSVLVAVPPALLWRTRSLSSGEVMTFETCGLAVAALCWALGELYSLARLWLAFTHASGEPALRDAPR